VEVVFARGTGDPAGVGPTGQEFVDALRPQVGDKSLDVYPVNYPATDQWATGVDGVRDAGVRLQPADRGSAADAVRVLMLGGHG
jgi:cutinase